jgi:hypothetical protein
MREGNRGEQGLKNLGNNGRISKTARIVLVFFFCNSFLLCIIFIGEGERIHKKQMEIV